MTTAEALKDYNSVAGAIFCKDNRKLFGDGAFKASTLEKMIQKLVDEKNLGDRMFDNDSGDRDLGKTFICAMPALNMAQTRRFRTYHVRENASTNCMIWEAARATTAAPTFFKQIAIGEDGHMKEKFVDGGLRCNNPADEVIREARAVFGDNVTLGCLVSIGTGHQGVIELPERSGVSGVFHIKEISALKKIATDCEETDKLLMEKFTNTPDRHYFRYSVRYGADRISLEEWEEMPKVETYTKAYLQESDVSKSIDVTVKILCKQGEVASHNVTLGSLS